MVLAERDLDRNYVYKQRREVYRHNRNRPKTVKKQKKKGMSIVSLAVVACAVLFMLFRFSAINESQVRVNKLKAELKNVTEQSERLRVEAASLKAVARVEDIAKNKLNMREPGSSQIIYLND